MTTDVIVPEMELVLEEDSSSFTLPRIEPGLEAVLSTLRQGDFVAQGGPYQPLEGEVHKSEYNWKLKQTSEDQYSIIRRGLKFNGNLVLHVDDGEIKGIYHPGWTSSGWKINGTYDPEGNVHCEINVPFGLGITLHGTITPYGQQ